MPNELIWRLGTFLTLFALFAALEAWAPRRPRSQSQARRWATNLAMTVLNTLALRGLAILLPLLAISAAAGLVQRAGDQPAGTDPHQRLQRPQVKRNLPRRPLKT